MTNKKPGAWIVPVPVATFNSRGEEVGRDRMRFYEIARGSTLECAAALRVLQVQRALSLDAHEAGHDFCERLYAMLTRMVR